jgi:hypothetical protein
MSEEKRALKPEVIELSNSLKASIKVDAKTGVGTAEENIYDRHLPESLDKQVVKAVREYDSNFVAAATNAFGELSIEAMAANKSLNSTSVEMTSRLGPTVGISMERSKTYPVHIGEGGDVTKHGVTRVTTTFSAGKNSGQLKIARGLLNALAADALAGK